MQRALKLQETAKATKDAYSRAVRGTAEYFDRWPDDSSAEELREYFANLLETHSWGTNKLDRCALQFFCRHVLRRPWDWVDILTPPSASPLADMRRCEQTLRLLGAVYRLCYQMFFLTLYCTVHEIASQRGIGVGGWRH